MGRPCTIAPDEEKRAREAGDDERGRPRAPSPAGDRSWGDDRAGGPRPVEDIERAHAGALALAAAGQGWPLKVILDGSTSAAGWVTIFPSTSDGEPIYEMGWMVLPELQGRGIASKAVGAMLEKARKERKFGDVHAFPGVSNAPRNRVCAKNGFSNVGECDVEFGGHRLRCNHWRVELF